MAHDDSLLIEACRELLGFGSIRSAERRKAHWKDTVQLRVHSRRAIRLAVIPFFDQFLLPSHKRTQFDEWRTDYERYVLGRRLPQAGSGPRALPLSLLPGHRQLTATARRRVVTGA